MLVLGRKAGETIRIGNDVVVTVCRIKNGGQVAIGIEAPKDVQIVRGELLAKTVSSK